MRAPVAVVLMLQLLLHGMAVPHSHARIQADEPSNHDSRPHIHIPCAIAHDHCRHAGLEHVHHHGRQTGAEDSHNDPPVVPGPDHDHDAIYVGNDFLTATTERSQVSDDGGFSYLIEPAYFAVVSAHIASVDPAATGPPPRCRDHFALLPHLLRI